MPQPQITLEYNGQKFGLFLAEGVKSVEEHSAEESTFNARFSRGKKKYGDDPLLTLAEWRDWTGGRGEKNFEDDASAFYDGKAWTLSPGTVVPAPHWYIATGLRTENRHMPGSMYWIPLVSENRFVSVSFEASSAYDAAHIWLFVRRVGSPGTLTVTLSSDNATVPGSALKTVTKTISDITDYIDLFQDFAPSSAQSLTSTTVYHITAYGGESDGGDNHWEIGGDRIVPGSLYSTDGISWTAATYSLYYRVTAAHVSYKYSFINVDGTVYAVSKPGSGTSSFYSFDNTSAFAAAGGTTGLTIVSGRPVVSGSYMYFPQGESTYVRRWDLSTTWANEAYYATYMQNWGKSVAKANNGTGTSTVAFAPKAAAMTFGTAVECGDGHYPVTNLLVHNGDFYVFKQDQIGKIYNGEFSLQDSNLKYTPSSRNGAAVCSWNGLMYFSWLNTMIENYSGTANDIGQSWKGRAAGGDRSGYYSCILGVNAWRICGIDAGASGYSSVQIFTGTSWHEIYRAPYGHRIRDMWWQHVDGGHSRLFIDIDYDIVYLEFPTDVANPTKDTTHKYNHSFYITSSSFDDGAARLPKYFKTITLSTTNCGTIQDTDVWFEVDYQTDNDVGFDGADHWRSAGKVFISPEGTLNLNLGNKRVVRFRVRGYTDTQTTPPQLDAVTIDGFTRTPARTVWTMKVKIGERAVYKKNASQLLKFLQEASFNAGDILVTSTIPELNGKHVIITRPRVYRELLSNLAGYWTGTMVLSFMDMTD